MLGCTISFSLWWTMVKMAIYTQKCEQKLLKTNNRGVGIKMPWMEKNWKINNQEGGWLLGTREYCGLTTNFKALLVSSYWGAFLLICRKQLLSFSQSDDIWGWQICYRPCNFIKTAPQHECFHENFPKFSEQIFFR